MSYEHNDFYMDDEMKNKVIRAMQIIAEAGECDCRTYHETCVKVLDLGLGSPASIKDYVKRKAFGDENLGMIREGNLIMALDYVYNYVTIDYNAMYCLEIMPFVQEFLHAIKE